MSTTRWWNGEEAPFGRRQHIGTVQSLRQRMMHRQQLFPSHLNQHSAPVAAKNNLRKKPWAVIGDGVDHSEHAIQLAVPAGIFHSSATSAAAEGTYRYAEDARQTAKLEKFALVLRDAGVRVHDRNSTICQDGLGHQTLPLPLPLVNSPHNKSVNSDCQEIVSGKIS